MPLTGATKDAVDDLRNNSFGRLLLRASRAYNDGAIWAVRAAGHTELTIAHASILPHIDIDGSRLTTISERAGMTKQSASELIGGLERLGYLRRIPDQDDGRAQLIVFTERGERFLLAAYDAKRVLEKDLEEKLGSGKAATLVKLLREYVDASDTMDQSGMR